MTHAAARIIDHARMFSSDKEIEDFYAETGYVSVKDCIPLDSIKNLQRELNDFLACCAPDMGANFDEICINLDKKDKKLLYELYKAGSNLAAFKNVSKALSEIVKKINGKNVPALEVNIAFLIGLPKDKRLVYEFHQESSYDSIDVKKFDNIINVHYPIFRKSSLANGTMSALVSSHKLGPLPGDIKRAADNALGSVIPQNIEAIVKMHPEVHFELEVGDCLFFHKDLVHRSNFNGTDLCRPIGTSRLFQAFSSDFIKKIPAAPVNS